MVDGLLNDDALTIIVREKLPVKLRNGNKAHILGDVRKLEPKANLTENPLNIYPLIGFSVDEENDIEYLQWLSSGAYIDNATESECDIVGLWSAEK